MYVRTGGMAGLIFWYVRTPVSYTHLDVYKRQAFDRCVDVMTQLLQKYGHQVLDKLEQDAPQTADCSKDDKQAQPLTDKAA